MNDKSASMYSGKLRVRVSGICIENNALLLIRHEGIGEKGTLWIPPGGGVDFGENSDIALQREFKEEANVDINVDRLLFVNEFMNNRLHAVELFFLVSIRNGRPALGHDPEFSVSDQMIKEIRFVTFEELRVMDKKVLHNSLHNITNEESLLNMSGYFKFSQ